MGTRKRVAQQCHTQTRGSYTSGTKALLHAGEPYKARMRTGWAGSYKPRSWVDPYKARMHTGWVGSYKFRSWVDPYKTHVHAHVLVGAYWYRYRCMHWCRHEESYRYSAPSSLI